MSSGILGSLICLWYFLEQDSVVSRRGGLKQPVLGFFFQLDLEGFFGFFVVVVVWWWGFVCLFGFFYY